ncbi:MAG: 1-pyrroline-5-carboxylate dehydrogenase [Candidatus Lumbricidophila eiseniae]|uniref:L-glutamate gamma-semialdehyde dehydrogenase n=1 Tax=Candidatus Lumbricidiphila eiseniae TaxID=1969409 RepID=A0A2A6FSH9_9MICO|nr:MAG: 1-pyrroline-5-carboxylate dehydrogenase [Candidatus Lumbricidophila eiseniae]
MPSTDAVIAQVRQWISEASARPLPKAARMLNGVLKDRHGRAFTVGFVDGVVRPESVTVAAHNLREVAKIIPAFLPWYLRVGVRVGSAVSHTVPWIGIPVARRVFRGMVGDLVLDASPAKLGPRLARLRDPRDRLNINLLGEAVLGEQEAQRRYNGACDLLRRDDVDYVSLKVSSVVSHLSMWAFDEAVEQLVTRLTPLYEIAARNAGERHPSFINLDMEEYRDLDLTIEVFTRILDQPQFEQLEAGIVLQAYLPDALGAMQRLNGWATARRAAGGAPVKVRLVKGANIPMERVESALRGWPLATYTSKADTDANYKRVLHWALTPERTDAVRLGIAGHNLFDIAHAYLTAQQRGVLERVEFEMLQGMSPNVAAAVRNTVGHLLLYTPVVNPAEFDVAIAYLIRRIDELASPDNFMSAAADLADDDTVFERERDRYLAALKILQVGEEPVPNRTQNRTAEAAEATVSRGMARGSGSSTGSPAGAECGVDGGARGIPNTDRDRRLPSGITPGFQNEPDTDTARAANREWGRAIIERSAGSRLGVATTSASTIADRASLDQLLGAVRTHAHAWAARPVSERAEILHRAGDMLATHRGALIEVMAAEAGKTIAEADAEVSEAIDFAHYYAERARELTQVAGARFVPACLTVVIPPWNFPVAIPAGGVLAALAAGSGVVIKPASLAQRCSAVMVEALWAAGVPREVLAFVTLADRSLGETLVADERVDRVILTGSYETAELFRSFRRDLPLLAETSGKNAIIVTPSADLEIAAADVVKSAFGHAGQKCSAASLLILVGPLATSERLHRQIVDAATSLHVGYPTDLLTEMGPLIEPARGKLLRALTHLEPGEQWLLQPRQLDDSGRLWSPGIKTGVAVGSYSHLTEFFGPVLSIMHAATFDEAIMMQNAVAYGLTAGLHTLDPQELQMWLDRVEAGNLYVNRGITGAIVQRQPFGGWKRSGVGAGAKAGGPNYLCALGEWEAAALENPPDASSDVSLEPRVRALVEASVGSLSSDQVRLLWQSVRSDEQAWRDEFSQSRDASALGFERNLLRYRPAPTLVRVAADASIADAVRVIAAGVRAGSLRRVSLDTPLPDAVVRVLSSGGVDLGVEPDPEWLLTLSRTGLDVERVRLVGGSARDLAGALNGSVDIAVWSHPVTHAGRVELLPFLREQSVSLTNHRFGIRTEWADGIV